MPKIKTLQECKFAEGGHDVIVFAAGDTVIVSDECASVLLAAGWAEPVDDVVAPVAAEPVVASVAEPISEHVAERKSQSNAPANKARTSPRNK